MRKFESGNKWGDQVSVGTETHNDKRAIIFEQDSDLVCLSFEAIDDLIEFLRAEQERLK